VRVSHRHDGGDVEKGHAVGFEEAAERMASAQMARFGRAIRYLPKEGGAVETVGVVERLAGPDDLDWPSGQDAQAEAMELLVWASEVPSPKYRDEVEVDGETWKVQPRKKPEDGGLWRLWCIRDLRASGRTAGK
jgi:hypothetical protein